MRRSARGTLSGLPYLSHVAAAVCVAVCAVSCQRTTIEAGADSPAIDPVVDPVAAEHRPSPETPRPQPPASAKPPEQEASPPPEEDSSPSPEEMRAAFAKMVASLEPVDDPDAPPNPLAGCVTCHADVETDYKAGGHYGEDVDCVTCHGASEGHVADENNEVQPDELFARKDVDRLCGHCHDCTRDERASPPSDPGTQRPVCIDCHGPHDPALLGPGVWSRPPTGSPVRAVAADRPRRRGSRRSGG